VHICISNSCIAHSASCIINARQLCDVYTSGEYGEEDADAACAYEIDVDMIRNGAETRIEQVKLRRRSTVLMPKPWVAALADLRLR
jgi:hypothetical protein